MIPPYFPASQVVEIETTDDQPVRLGSVLDIKPMSVLGTCDRAWSFASCPDGPWFPVPADHPFDLCVADATDWWVRTAAPTTLSILARGLPG